MNKIVLGIFLAVTLWSCKSDTKENVTFSETGDAAIDAISKEIEKDPSAQNYYLRAQALYNSEDYARSISDAEKAISLDSLQADYYHLLADGYMDYYRSKEALATMRRVLKIYPTRVPSLLKLAELEYIVQRYDLSVFNCNLILKDHPQNAEAFFMLGMNFRALGDREKAINSFQTAVEFDPDLIDAWIILGDLYGEKGDKKALKYYDAALVIAPEKNEVKHSKAFYLQNNGDIPAALALYRDIIIKDPSYGPAFLNSGILYLQLDSLDKAYEQFDILANREPQNANAYFYRAQVSYIKGDLTSTEQDLQNTLRINPEDKDAKKLLEEVMKAKKGVK